MRQEACKHPFKRKTSFGIYYCPNCQKNLPKEEDSKKPQDTAADVSSD